MVNKPLLNPYFWGGSFGGVARIPMILPDDATIAVLAGMGRAHAPSRHADAIPRAYCNTSQRCDNPYNRSGRMGALLAACNQSFRGFFWCCLFQSHKMGPRENG